MKKAILCGGYDPKACAGCSCSGTPPCFEWTDEYPPVEVKNASIEKELEVVYDSIPPELVVAMTIWGEAGKEPIREKLAVASKISDAAAQLHLATGYPILMCLSSVCRNGFSCWNDGQFVRQQPDKSAGWTICDRIARHVVISDLSTLCETDEKPNISLFGLLVCTRTSERRQGKPCEEAEKVPFVYVERFKMYNDPVGKAWNDTWYDTGRNHRIENGVLVRDFDETRWMVRIADRSALQAFIEKYGEIVLSLNNDAAEPCYQVEIYDDYRE